MNEKVNDREMIEYCLHYYNFSFIKDYSHNLQLIFNLACKYDYVNFFWLLVDIMDISINTVIDKNSNDTPLHIAALKNNVEIIDILLKKSNIEIKHDSFTNCEKLTKVSLPPILKEIENNMFDGCKSLVDISIPSSVTKIGWYAFRDCSSLKEIFIPSSVLVLAIQRSKNVSIKKTYQHSIICYKNWIILFHVLFIIGRNRNS